MTSNGAVARGAVVRTEHLTKTFVGTEALVGLSIELLEGAVFALIGPNGAGKTTDIKTILNIFRPCGGAGRRLPQARPPSTIADRVRIGESASAGMDAGGIFPLVQQAVLSRLEQ